MEVIRSRKNALIKQAKKLQQKKHRTSAYLIEGWHLLEEAQKAGAQIECIFLSEEEQSRLSPSSKIQLVSAEVLADLSDSKTPQGVVAQVRFKKSAIQELRPGKFLVLEDVQDPGNVGTMIRTADAAGYDAVFLSDKCADIYNSKVLRSMQGSHFHLPIYRLSMRECIEVLGKLQVPIIATTLSTESVDYKLASIPSCFALVMGNEGKGVSEELIATADQLVHISMPGRAESLNVAVAAGILLFHFL